MEVLGLEVVNLIGKTHQEKKNVIDVAETVKMNTSWEFVREGLAGREGDVHRNILKAKRRETCPCEAS